MSLRIHALLATLFLLPAFAWADGTNCCLSTALEMAQALDGQLSQSWSFSITGAVTWCNRSYLILKDETGCCSLFNADLTNIGRGDIIEANGRAHMNVKKEPWIDKVTINKLGYRQIPVPDKIELKDCLNPALALEGVRTEATVIDVRMDELSTASNNGFDWLILKDGAMTFPVACPHDESNKALIDAYVEVSGPIFRQVLGVRKFVSPFINLDLGGSIKILSMPANDPFDFPELKPVRFISPDAIEQLGKHTAVGKIVAAWPANNCLLMTPDGTIVRLELASTESLPPRGSLVKAVGYPSSDLFTYWLTRAKVRPEEMADFPEPAPIEISSDEVCSSLRKLYGDPGRSYFNRLVSISGVVKLLETHADGTLRVILACGEESLPVDFSTHPEEFAKIAVGSEIKVTGRCLLVNDRWNPNNVFPSVKGILIVLTAQPRLLHGPGWWTVGKLLTVIILLFIALVATLLRFYYTKRFARIKLKERTELAVEIHDSLSQTMTGLACHITTAQNTLHTDVAIAEKKLTTASQMLMSCRTELRNCLFDLRNDTLSEKNFHEAILRTLEPFEDSVTLLVRFNVPRKQFEDYAVHAILAIIRELVSNGIRHGKAWTVKVAGIIENDALLFSVSDDGAGFDVEHRMDSEDGHFGIDGIRERLARLDGSITYKQPRAGGTRAVVRIPLHHT